MTQQERRDQQRFDDAVARKGKVVLQVVAGLGIVAALMMSIVALNNSSEKNEVNVAAKPATQAAATAPAAAKTATASTQAAKTVSLKIIGSYKKGPDGKMHDAFTVTNFAVKVGQPLKLQINNTDDVPHSITSAVAGVNVIAQPGTHTYTLLVNKAGKFEWNCMLPCDGDAGGWAMQNPGYMSGYITAT